MKELSCCKLEIFIPETHLDALEDALRKVDAGHIGDYDCCLSYSRVTSRWRPLPGTSPYLGQMGEVCIQWELKVEVTCFTSRLKETVDTIKAAHPYEQPVINVIPLYCTGL